MVIPGVLNAGVANRMGKRHLRPEQPTTTPDEPLYFPLPPDYRIRRRVYLGGLPNGGTAAFW